jgi:aerobic carbon-monoxide dehydrogenase medium subunit
MIPKEFEYLAPTSVEEAVRLLQEHGDRAKILAGGHGLIPRMKRRLENPAVLVDVGRIPELKGIRRDNGVLTVGAMTTHADLEGATGLFDLVPLLPQAAKVVADPLVRNRGTFGGSLADAEPGADWPAVALALGASLQISGANGERAISIDDFFVGPMETALEPEELLTRIDIPVPAGGSGMRYEKLVHPASGYAVVGVATATEEMLVGETLSSDLIRRAARQANERTDFLGDHYASASYRSELVNAYAERTLLAVSAEGTNGTRRW